MEVRFFFCFAHPLSANAELGARKTSDKKISLPLPSLSLSPSIRLTCRIADASPPQVLAHGLYANACAKGDHCVPTTWDIFHEKRGAGAGAAPSRRLSEVAPPPNIHAAAAASPRPVHGPSPWQPRQVNLEIRQKFR